MRFDLQSAIVMGMATVSSLAVAWVLSHQSPRAAEAATPVQPMAQSVIVPVTGQPAQIAKSADGHFWAEADIDGRAIRVLVDTGASVVALTRDDALRLGLRLTPADFNQTVETASGPAKAAAIQLDHVAVAGARVRTGPGAGRREGPAPLPARHELSGPPVGLRGTPHGPHAETLRVQTIDPGGKPVRRVRGRMRLAR
ncbi:TIGR02281 family clan AA aspartic protease [Brevundimonas subvibrioides]|uniref:TIGR02281 family clan AA aspartic protease n=1 Tax=Brevundimonas subvibrioides TaxID=74313 RepID=UPI0032D5914C